MSDDGCTCDYPGIHVDKLITKRFRSLNRKLNLIYQLEFVQSQGYFLNVRQQATLNSKFLVTGAIRELRNIAQPLIDAVSKDIQVAIMELEEVDDEMEENPSEIEDLLKIMYVGDLSCPPAGNFPNSVTEMDFHFISAFAKLIRKRRFNSRLSHQEALAESVDRARRFLDGSDDDVEFYPGVTYGGLRQKLEKIIASDYFITPPQMRPPGDVAAAYGSYQVPVQELAATVNLTDLVEVSPQHHGHREEEMAVDVVGNGNNNESVGLVAVPEQQVVVQEDGVDQRQQQEYVPRGQSQNQRGGGRGMNGGGRRGYPGGGRGGRGGRGGFRREGYPDGRNHYYDQVGGSSYPRDNYYRGRGGRGGTGSGSYPNGPNHYEGGVGGQGGGGGGYN